MRIICLTVVVLVADCFVTANKNILNNDEVEILQGLIEHLRVRTVVFVLDEFHYEHGMSTLQNLSIIGVKFFFMTEQEVVARLLFPFEQYDFLTKPIIVHKSGTDFVTMNKILYCFSALRAKVEENFWRHGKQLFRFSRFIWLIFVKNVVTAPLNHFNFAVPYDCQFFIVHPIDSEKYKIIKIFTLGKNRIFDDFGTYANNNYNFSKVMTYPTKVDMNHTAFYLVIGNCTKVRESHFNLIGKPDPACMKVEFFRDLIKSMKFRYLEVTGNLLMYVELGFNLPKFDVSTEMYHWHSGGEVGKKLIKYWQKSKLVLYIKYPITEKADDFYTHPFHVHFWITILIFIVVGGFFCVMMQSVKKKMKPQMIFYLLDHLLLPYEYLLYQGKEYDSDFSFRLFSITFRLLGTFIFYAFCSNVVAYLSAPIFKPPFDSLEELVEGGQYKVLVEDYGYLDLFLEEFYNNTSESQPEFVDYYNSISELGQKICSEKKYAFAYFTDEYFSHDSNCRLFRILRPVSSVLPGMLVNDNNAYIHIINHMMLKSRESGLMPRAIKMIESSMGQRFLPAVAEDFLRVELSQVMHLFAILGFGFFASAIFLVGEFFMYLVFNIFSGRSKHVKFF